jgi:hypothetical protein
MGFSMASRSSGNEKQRCFSLPGGREAIKNPIKLNIPPVAIKIIKILVKIVNLSENLDFKSLKITI